MSSTNLPSVETIKGFPPIFPKMNNGQSFTQTHQHCFEEKNNYAVFSYNSYSANNTTFAVNPELHKNALNNYYLSTSHGSYCQESLKEQKQSRQLFSNHSPGREISCEIPVQPTKIKKSRRLVYSASQLEELEKQFAVNSYIGKDRRNSLAATLNIPEYKLKTWFQNRRTKQRRIEERKKKSLSNVVPENLSLVSTSSSSSTSLSPHGTEIANYSTDFQNTLYWTIPPQESIGDPGLYLQNQWNFNNFEQYYGSYHPEQIVIKSEPSSSRDDAGSQNFNNCNYSFDPFYNNYQLYNRNYYSDNNMDFYYSSVPTREVSNSSFLDWFNFSQL